MITLEPRGDVMVKTVVTEEPLIVDWDDIATKIESDDWTGEAPWEACDGWEHEFVPSHFRDDPYKTLSYKYVRNNGCGYIEVTDKSIIEWGCVGYPGCSKQVRFESIARAKRKATEQLAKWYENGWEWFVVSAEYNDYSSSIGGIDCYKYAEKLAKQCRHIVADQLESDGYIVTGRPPEPKLYSSCDAFKDRIRRNLNQSK